MTRFSLIIIKMYKKYKQQSTHRPIPGEIKEVGELGWKK
jgi:hypothetical protein